MHEANIIVNNPTKYVAYYFMILLGLVSNHRILF